MDEEVDLLEEEEEVLHNAMVCPSCAEFEGHDILASKPKGNGHDHRVRCQGCSHVYTVHLRPPRAVEIPFMLTDGPDSQMVSLELDADEVLDLDDVFEDGGMLWRVTHLEDPNGHSITSGEAERIRRVVALREDLIRVRLTLTIGERSKPDHMVCAPDTNFSAGTMIEHGGRTWILRAIHTGRGRTLRGTVQANRIVRMYLHQPPAPEPTRPMSGRERRQAWKEGRLGFNPNPTVPKPNEEQGKRRGRR
ncbi:MAG: hypothetical protein DWC11_02295 [Candidatus Poseidoniales archaeon]|nr:MAG: hypothetical protein DWC11_02295 [Candidatus Poseidoniales archaeon]